jgi:hypothetical protein
LVYRLEEKTPEESKVTERATIYDQPKVIFEMTNNSVEEITSIDFNSLKSKPLEESEHQIEEENPIYLKIFKVTNERVKGTNKGPKVKDSQILNTKPYTLRSLSEILYQPELLGENK